MHTNPHLRVKLGPRIYTALSWKRKDCIYRGDQKIGVIKLSDSNRAGVTICLATYESRPGRAIDWCDSSTPHTPKLD